MTTPSSLSPSDLPHGDAPEPLATDHFPSRLHAFIFRNWHAVEPARLARVLRTDVEQVSAVAASMGLATPRPFETRHAKRGYFTVLRRNWHLLPYEQILELLDMTAEKLGHALREDDFLWIKMGRLKPRCDPLHFAPPTGEEVAAAERLRGHLDGMLETAIAPRFEFLDNFSEADPSASAPPATDDDAIRVIYSYAAMFGDPLADSSLDPYPDGLLQRLAALDVNGVWMHVVLRDLAPGAEPFPEFGEGHGDRLQALKTVASRAARHGIGIYLYLNEPRAMPSSFFAERGHLAGVKEEELVALCTSCDAVRNWMRDAVAHIFDTVPDLAGIITITASENLTSCASHGRRDACPRCRDRTEAEIIAEVNNVLAEGVDRVKPSAEVMAWDWGWNRNELTPDIIAHLAPRIRVLSASEWKVPIRRGGVETEVGEYSVSAVGPGPRARGQWALAREHGLKCAAKVQLNCTWELASLPYLPVMDLVAQHCRGLAEAGITSMLLSWSLGCYPSPNLEIAAMFARDPSHSEDDVLDALARRRYGAGGAPAARAAWRRFSEAFRQYPYHIAVVYFSPMQLGPANLLYPRPTGYGATTTCIPYDDVKRWSGPYPPETLARQFEKVAEGFHAGLTDLAAAVDAAPSAMRPAAEDELRYARAITLYFRSAAAQVRFVLHRERLAEQPPDSPAAGISRSALRAILRQEIRDARQLFDLACEDSRIGYEAANAYFYLPIDLAEKVVNCQELLRQLAGTGGSRK